MIIVVPRKMIRRVPWGATWRIYLQSNQNWVWISFAIGCWTNELLKDRWTIYNDIKIIRRWCTSKVFMGDNDNKKEVNKWLSWQFNNSDFGWCKFCWNGCCREAAKAFNGQLKTKQSIVYCWYRSVKRKKRYCCNDIINNPRGDIDAYQWNIGYGRRTWYTHENQSS